MMKRLLSLLLVPVLAFAATPIKDAKLTGSPQVPSAVTLNIDGTLSIRSGGSLTSQSGSTVNLSAGTLILPADVSRLGSTIDLSSEVTGSLPWASLNKAGSSLNDLATKSASDLNSGVLAAARGGAGTVSGILKGNGSGTVSAAVAGTDFQVFDADLDALAGVSSNGLLARTGGGSAAARTITAGNGVSVSNGDGVSGNPVVSLDFATQAEAEAGTNSTKPLSAQRTRQAVARYLRSNVRHIDLGPSGWVPTSGGSGASQATDRNIIDIVTGGTTGSSMLVRNNAGGTNGDLVYPGDQYNQVLWSRPVIYSFVLAVQNTDSNTSVRVKFGDLHNNTTIGDFSNRGVGVIIANTSLQVTAHNGTTLASPVTVATLTTGSTPTLYDVSLVLDGAGGWVCYLNGSSVGSGSGAPSTLSPNNGCSISASVTNGAGTSFVRLMIPEITVTWP